MELSWFGGLERIQSICCVLEWSFLLLYWMRCLECLDGYEWGGWGYLYPLTTSIAVENATGDGRTGQSGAPPDRHCSLSGAPPRHPTVRVRSWSTVGGFVLLQHQIVRCHTGQSGASRTSCSDFCRDTVYFEESTVGADSHCSAGSPDSPVNYSGACPEIPESGWFGLVRPGAPDSPVCQSSAHSSLFAPIKLCP
jgi:hypothetical protein